MTDLTGKTKEKTGELTGDDDLKREGKGDQAAEKVKDTAEKVTDKVKDTLKKD